MAESMQWGLCLRQDVSQANCRSLQQQIRCCFLPGSATMSGGRWGRRRDGRFLLIVVPAARSGELKGCKWPGNCGGLVQEGPSPASAGYGVEWYCTNTVK